MRIVNKQDKHLRYIKCDCCGSTIEYGINDVVYHSQFEEMGFGDAILVTITCLNCDSLVYID